MLFKSQGYFQQHTGAIIWQNIVGKGTHVQLWPGIIMLMVAHAVDAYKQTMSLECNGVTGSF
eukprot:453634-Pelagomonas_calceolata.AAC.4